MAGIVETSLAFKSAELDALAAQDAQFAASETLNKSNAEVKRTQQVLSDAHAALLASAREVIALAVSPASELSPTPG